MKKLWKLWKYQTPKQKRNYLNARKQQRKGKHDTNTSQKFDKYIPTNLIKGSKISAPSVRIIKRLILFPRKYTTTCKLSIFLVHSSPSMSWIQRKGLTLAASSGDRTLKRKTVTYMLFSNHSRAENFPLIVHSFSFCYHSQ